MDRAEPNQAAILSLRALILAGERYRQVISDHVGVGVTETQAVSYLAVHGDRGQNELAADLGLTSGASTALVDRLERQGIAQRYPHPSDRRRTLVRLTDRGHAIVNLSGEWLGASLRDISPADLDLVTASLQSIADRLFEKPADIAQHREPAFVSG